MNFIEPSGSIIVDLLTTKVRLFYTFSEPDSRGDRIIRFCLQDGVLDSLPPETGADFPCRVAWSWADSALKFGTTQTMRAYISCRTSDGKSGSPGAEVFFKSFQQIVEYLQDGKLLT